MPDIDELALALTGLVVSRSNSNPASTFVRLWLTLQSDLEVQALQLFGDEETGEDHPYFRWALISTNDHVPLGETHHGTCHTAEQVEEAARRIEQIVAERASPLRRLNHEQDLAEIEDYRVADGLWDHQGFTLRYSDTVGCWTRHWTGCFELRGGMATSYHVGMFKAYLEGLQYDMQNHQLYREHPQGWLVYQSWVLGVVDSHMEERLTSTGPLPVEILQHAYQSKRLHVLGQLETLLSPAEMVEAYFEHPGLLEELVAQGLDTEAQREHFAAIIQRITPDLSPKGPTVWEHIEEEDA